MRAQTATRVAIPLTLTPSRCAPALGELLALGGATMGTTWSVRCVADAARAPVLHAAIERALALVIAQMSPWQPDSDLCRFNRAPIGAWQTIPLAFLQVMQCALRVARDSDGAFDPALGALIEQWGFGARPPSTAAWDSAPSDAGFRALELDIEGRRLRRLAPVQLDLCGIAKGFAVDLVTQALRDYGVDHALVEIGGELAGRGVKPDGTPWWVTIDRATVAPAHAPLLVALHEMAIATSGTERGYMHDGRHHSHSIDAASGAPIDNGLVAASVLHASCMEADGYATALMVLGPARGLAFAARHRLAAALTWRDGHGQATETLTPALAAMLN